MLDIEKEKPDRRKFIRVKADLLTNFRVFCTLEEIKDAELQNISEGGLMFTSNQSLSNGQPLEVKLSVPVLSGMIEFEGTVVWNERTENRVSYNTGVAVSNITPEEQEKLKRLTEKTVAQD